MCLLYSQLFLAGEICWPLANAGVKVSIINYYIKIFRSNRKFRMYAYIILGLTLVYCLMVILTVLLICTPFAFHWDTNIKGGSCANQSDAYLVSGVLNLLLDICVIVLPMPLLWGLKMPIRKKLGLAFMFGIGFLQVFP